MSDQRDIDPQSVAAPIEGPAGRKVIAVIGIDRYRHWPALTNATSDGEGARSLFRGLGFDEVTAPLFDEQATGTALRTLVTDDLMCLGTNDSLVLFYAGHGSTRTQRLGDQQIELGYLIPSDAANEPDRVATWIDLAGWLRRVSFLPAKHILVILDACHSGIALDPVLKWRDVRSWQSAPLATLSTRRSRRIITSALGDQVALDGGPIHGHSLFTGCLIEGLRHGIARDGRRFTTGSELGLHVQQRVQAYPHSRQTPDFGTFDFDERGEMLIPFPVDEDAASSRPAHVPAPATWTAPSTTPPPTTPARPGAASGRLSGIELAEVREVLLDSFDKNGLDRFLSDHFEYDRDVEVGDGSFRDIVDRLLRDFTRQGRIALLLARIAAARPLNASIQEIASTYGAR